MLGSGQGAFVVGLGTHFFGILCYTCLVKQLRTTPIACWAYLGSLMQTAYSHLDVATLRELLARHIRSLVHLQNQAANFGSMYVPTPLSNEIKDCIQEIELIKAELKSRQIKATSFKEDKPINLKFIIRILVIVISLLIILQFVSTNLLSLRSITSLVEVTSTSTSRIFEISPRISAIKGWQNAAIKIHSGDMLEIKHISGLWTENKNETPPTNPEGISPTEDYNCTPMSHKQTGFNALIGKIGDNTPFKVGSNFLEHVSQEGQLYLRINDCDESLSDNDGEITVFVIVTR